MQSLNYEMSNHFTFVKKLSRIARVTRISGEGQRKSVLNVAHQ